MPERVHILVDIGCLECEGGFIADEDRGYTTELVGIYPERQLLAAQALRDQIDDAHGPGSDRAVRILTGEIREPTARELELQEALAVEWKYAHAEFCGKYPDDGHRGQCYHPKPEVLK